MNLKNRVMKLEEITMRERPDDARVFTTMSPAARRERINELLLKARGGSINGELKFQNPRIYELLEKQGYLKAGDYR